MKPKTLIALAMVLVILAALVLFKKQGEKQPGIVEEAQLAQLLPAGITTGDIGKLELYIGGRPDEKVVMSWDAEAGKWRVQTLYNVPADAEKADEYLDALVKLKGEFRAKAETDASRELYGLTNETAFHVTGYGKGGDAPQFDLLFGKSPGYEKSFVRTAAGNEVYVVNMDTRAKAGIYGDKQEQAPAGDQWVKKTILQLDKDAIKRVAITGPDKGLVFEKREKPTPQTETEPEGEKAESGEKAGSGETEEAEAAETEQKPAPKPEYEWVLASGGVGGPHRQSALDALLRKLGSLRAVTVVDPAKKEEWGLAQPPFTCVISLEGQDDVVVEGSRPDGAKNTYMRVATAKEDIVYEVLRYDFEAVFPKGTDLFDMPGLTLDKGLVQRIEIDQPEGKVVLAKKGEEDWSVVTPAADLNTMRSKIDTLVSGLANWKAADYADSPDGKGLDAPSRSLKAILKDGNTHTITLGLPSRYIAGVYAKLDSDPKVLAMSDVDRQRIFVAPKDLYERTFFDFDGEDITGIAIDRKTDPLKLERKEGAWQLSVADQPVEVDQAAADGVATAITELQAEDILFNSKALTGEAAATIRIVAADQPAITLTIGPEQEGGTRQILVSGKKQVFVVQGADINAAMPASDSLKKPAPAPEPQPETPPAPEPEAGAQPGPQPQTVVLPTPETAPAESATP